MKYKIFLPRKKVGVALLLFTFFVIIITWIITQLNGSITSNFLAHRYVEHFLGLNPPNLSTLHSLFGIPISKYFSFVFSDLKNCVWGMIVPFGFLVILFSYSLNIISVVDSLNVISTGSNIFSLNPWGIILNVYYLYIYALSIDTGFYITLKTVKRDKQGLKDEFGLFIYRFFFLFVLIITFEGLWWCFG
ncbi:MAG: hypothetical protein FJ150_01195 [Euryarchaeota archaeon]|nr:hypothetical protein [Euryarchaeota archaeon]